MKFLGSVLFLGLVGCGATRFDQSVINTPSGHAFKQCSRDRYGDQDCIRRVDSQVDMPGALGGDFDGLGLGYDSYAPARTPIYTAGPVVTDGQRAMEAIPSGPVVLEMGYGSASGSGPATGGSVPCASAGGCLTQEQGKVIVRNLLSHEHRLDTLEGKGSPSK